MRAGLVTAVSPPPSFSDSPPLPPAPPLLLVLDPPEDARQYSSLYNSASNQSTLASPIGWFPKEHTGWEHLTIDVGVEKELWGVVTKGSTGGPQWDAPEGWVTTYTVMVSTDGINFTSVDPSAASADGGLNNYGERFTGNSDAGTAVRGIFSTPVRARFVRIYTSTFYKWPYMRAGLLVV